MTLKELQEKRSKLAVKIRELGDKFKAQGDKWQDDAQRAAFDQVNKDYDGVLADITRTQEAEGVQQRMARLEEDDRRSVNHGTTTPGREDSHSGDRRQRESVGDEQRALALAGFFRNSDRAPSKRMREAMRSCRIGLHQRSLDIIIPPTHLVRDLQRPFATRNADFAREQGLSAEKRDLGTFAGAKGGVLIPGSFVRSLEVNMLFYGGIRQVAEQIVTATGDEMGWPTADDASNEGEQLGEAENMGDSDDPSFGLQKWHAYKFSSKPVLVDFEILEDSVIDLPTILGQMLGERLGRITNRKGTLGSGVGTSRGFMTSAARGKLTTSGSFNFDDVVDLEHSVDAAYRPGASFMCHDAIVAHMRKLKDGEGRNLWQSGATAMDIDTLHGRKLTLNQVMDDTVANGEKPLAFGDFRQIKMRRVNRVRVYRLQERFRDTDQDAFVAFVREDSQVLNAGTHPIKYLEVGTA